MVYLDMKEKSPILKNLTYRGGFGGTVVLSELFLPYREDSG